MISVPFIADGSWQKLVDGTSCIDSLLTSENVTNNAHLFLVYNIDSWIKLSKVKTWIIFSIRIATKVQNNISNARSERSSGSICWNLHQRPPVYSHSIFSSHYQTTFTFHGLSEFVILFFQFQIIRLLLASGNLSAVLLPSKSVNQTNREPKSHEMFMFVSEKMATNTVRSQS